MPARPNVHEGILYPVSGNVFHVAPVPLVYCVIRDADVDEMHRDLIRAATEHLSRAALDVPDERHVDDLGSVPEFPGDSWKEIHSPAVGVWHRVPTNNFLNIDAPSISWLRSVISAKHEEVLDTVGEQKYTGTTFMESWIQFYRNGDHKVLHNHQRYDHPYVPDMWVGAYYVTDGDPDPDKKYSGLLSFSIREQHYYVRPRPGLLLMWPYDILHQVHPFYGATERVVVNFHVTSAGPEQE